MIASLVARFGLGLLFGRLRDSLAKIPPKVWLVLAALAAAGALLWWHNHAVEEARKEGREAADKEWKGAFDTMHKAALDLTDAYNATATALANARKEAHEQDRRRIAADADALRLRGPGRAAAPVCGRRDAASLSPAPGGPDSPNRPADAPLAPMPDDQPAAILPWTGTVAFAESHDRWRSEALTWRSWHRDMRAAHEEARARLAKTKPEF